MFPSFRVFNRLKINRRGEIEREDISSSNLESQGYSERWKILEIEFQHSGEVYRYFGISKRVYEDMLNGHTPGQFFYHHIRKKFPYVRVQ